MNTTKLSSSAVLVNLSLSLWAGRKLDKTVSREIDQGKNTKTRAGNYHKNLFAGSKSLEAIQKIANECRTWHYAMTQPWGDNGDRLLNAALMPEYRKQLADYETQFGVAVNNFLTEYRTLVSAAAFSLGDLFDHSDYPDVQHLVGRFGFTYSFSPVPEVGDFRVDIGEEGLRDLQEQYERAMKARVEGAMTDAWERVRDVLNRMSDRLADDEKGGKKIFRDSIVSNALELCGLLKYFNFTNDTKLDAIRVQLEDMVTGINASTLRESDSVRRGIKAKVDGILDKFEF
jgi:hypothetical protein